MKKCEVWTPPKLVQWISKDFEQRGFPPPHRSEAEQIVSHALNISRLEIYLQYDKPCSQLEQTAVRKLVKRRHRREPLAYILGNCGFWSMTLQVGPGVLVPRQDTELLIEVALSRIPDNLKDRYQLLEFGTGSAAIPLALALERENLSVLSIDNSAQALHYASQNIVQYEKQLEKKNSQICLVRGDRFQAITERAIYDLIISNPPYIPKGEIDDLQSEVSEWEPREALDGGENGLDIFNYLLVSAESYLKPDGFLIFEHGFEQKKSIQTIMSSSKTVSFHSSFKDYNKQDRVLVYQKKTFV